MGTCCSKTGGLEVPLAKNHPQDCMLCQTKTLLYVDDDADNLDLFGGVLAHKWKSKGWGRSPPLETVLSGEKAVELVTSHPNRFPMIICDYSMPGINGVETCRRLMSLKPTIDCCILSAFAPSDERKKSPKIQFYSNPEDLETLYSRIHEFFGQRTQR